GRVDTPLLAQDRADLVAFDQAASHGLMRSNWRPEFLNRVREGVMAYVVEQGGRCGNPGVLLRDPVPGGAVSQMRHRLPGEVKDTERMVIAGVTGAGPDPGNKTQLLNPVQPLEGQGA